MHQSGLLNDLIQALCCLPGVGPKSAQRMAFHLLQKDQRGGIQLAETLLKAIDQVGHCQQCRTLTEYEVCHLCASSSRDETVLCVVETPADVWVVDQSAVFRGKFFVLHGRLSPLDGIGPDELGFDLLAQRLTLGLVKEIILATNATGEGEATAHFISEMARRQNITATRIAHGVPMGGELEYIDGGTLAHAFNGRREL